MTSFESEWATELRSEGCLQPTGFAVYRNTYMRACVDALEANFPAIVRLVGLPWFRAAAQAYARLHPPRQACLLFYGDEGFGHWVQSRAQRVVPEQEWRYLAGVARLDTFWRQSHAAGDAPVAHARLLLRANLEVLAAQVLLPHPACRWAWFEQHPAYSLWRFNREDGHADPDTLPWRSEGALLTRPAAQVQLQPLARSGVLLLDACARGLSLEEAAGAVLSAEPGTNLAALVQQLVLAGAWTAPQPSGDCCEP